MFFVLVVGLVAAFGSRFAALLLYLWFALFRPQEWVWFDITSFRLSLVLGLVLVVPSLLTGVYPNLTHPLSVGALAFVGSTLLAQVEAVRPDIGWIWIDYLVRLLLVCLLAVTLISTRQRFVAALAVIAGSFGFHGAKAGLGFLLGGGVQFYEGLGGAFIDSNGYALGIAMIVPMLFAAAQNLSHQYLTHRVIRLGFFVAVPLSAFGVVGLFSRGGFLSLAAGVLTMAWLHRRRFAALAMVLILGLLGFAFAPIPESYFERVETIRTYDEVGETSAIGRLHYWRVALNVALDRPLGVGLRSFEAAYDRYDFSNGEFGRERAVHNSYLQVLAEIGFQGFLVYMLMLVYAVIVLFRIRRRSRDPRLSDEARHFLFTASSGLIASIAAFLAGSTFISLAINDLTWLTFALTAALDRISLEQLSNRELRTADVADHAAIRWTSRRKLDTST